MEKESNNIDVQAIGHFLIGSRCQQELMSSYLDTEGVRCRDIKAVRCRDIKAVSCNQCGEGEGA
jgi:hypothetical protein